MNGTLTDVTTMDLRIMANKSTSRFKTIVSTPEFVSCHNQDRFWRGFISLQRTNRNLSPADCENIG